MNVGVSSVAVGFASHSFESVAAPRDQTDIGARFCQSERNCFANSATCTGDDGDLMLQ